MQSLNNRIRKVLMKFSSENIFLQKPCHKFTIGFSGEEYKKRIMMNSLVMENSLILFMFLYEKESWYFLVHESIFSAHFQSIFLFQTFTTSTIVIKKVWYMSHDKSSPTLWCNGLTLRACLSSLAAIFIQKDLVFSWLHFCQRVSI